MGFEGGRLWIQKTNRYVQVGGKWKINELSRNEVYFSNAVCMLVDLIPSSMPTSLSASIKPISVYLLIIFVFPVSMDLVLEGEIKGEV